METKKLTTFVVAVFSFVVLFCIPTEGNKTEAFIGSEKIEDVVLVIQENSRLRIEEIDQTPNNKKKVATIYNAFSQELPTCYKQAVGEDQNQYVRMASRISGNDIDFLALLDAENGLWTPTRKHAINNNGSSDWGFCGINDRWHPEITNDPKFLTDPEWQLEQCYRLYKGGTAFYGKARIPVTRKSFVCPDKII